MAVHFWFELSGVDCTLPIAPALPGVFSLSIVFAPLLVYFYAPCQITNFLVFLFLSISSSYFLKSAHCFIPHMMQMILRSL